MITKKLLCEKFVYFLADIYIDFNGVQQAGLGKLNSLLADYGIAKQLYENYSNGYQRTWGDEFCLVLQPSDNIDKGRGVIDPWGYENNTKLSIDVRFTGGADILYTLENYLPEILNTLAVNFVNTENEIIGGNSFYNLRFSTQAFLESPKETPNAYSTVSAVVARQDFAVDSIVRINKIS